MLVSDFSAVLVFADMRREGFDKAFWEGLLAMACNMEPKDDDDNAQRWRHRQLLDDIEENIHMLEDGVDPKSLIEQARSAARYGNKIALQRLLEEEAPEMKIKVTGVMLQKLRAHAEEQMVKYRHIPKDDRISRVETFDYLVQCLRKLDPDYDPHRWQTRAWTAVWEGEVDMVHRAVPERCSEQASLEHLYNIAERQLEKYAGLAHYSESGRLAIVRYLKERLRALDPECTDSAALKTARYLVAAGAVHDLHSFFSDQMVPCSELEDVLLPMAETQLKEYRQMDEYPPSKEWMEAGKRKEDTKQKLPQYQLSGTRWATIKAVWTCVE